MTIEQRMDQLEKHNKRLKVALTMTVVAMCAVETMAATGEKEENPLAEYNEWFDAQIKKQKRDEQKYGVFDAVTARTLNVPNDAGDIGVTLGVNDSGGGLVYSQSAKGNELMTLTSTVEG